MNPQYQPIPQQFMQIPPQFQGNPAAMGGRPGLNYPAEQLVQNLGMERPRHSEKSQQPSVYVGNLPTQSFYDLDLHKYFTTRGYKLSKSKVVLDKNTGKPRGYGYLTFYTQAEADRCIQEMNN